MELSSTIQNPCPYLPLTFLSNSEAISMYSVYPSVSLWLVEFVVNKITTPPLHRHPHPLLEK
jgi:hypothetical protein